MKPPPNNFCLGSSFDDNFIDEGHSDGVARKESHAKHANRVV